MSEADCLSSGVEALKSGDRLVAADAFEDAGRPDDAWLLRDPGLVPVVLSGDRVWRPALGDKQQGTYDVLVFPPAGPGSPTVPAALFKRRQALLRNSVSKGARARWSLAEKVRKKVVDHLIMWQWWCHYQTRPVQKRSVKFQRCQPSVRNEYVLVLSAPEAALFNRLFARK